MTGHLRFVGRELVIDREILARLDGPLAQQFEGQSTEGAPSPSSCSAGRASLKTDRCRAEVNCRD